MNITKTLYSFQLLICICFLLLSGCGTSNSSVSATSGGKTPTTLPPTHTPAATSTVSSTKLPADCPAADTTQAVNLPVDTSAVQPAVFYLTASGGVQSGINLLDLMRYDLTTGKTSSILTFDGSAIGYIPQVHLSPDKHWLLVTNTWKLTETDRVTRVLLMRTDGTQVQTLACTTSDLSIQDADWLPGGQQLAITRGRYNQQKGVSMYTVETLDLTTGASHIVFSGDYFPYAWLDNHQFVVYQATGKNNSTLAFFLVDINKGSHQKLADFTPIASFNAWGSLAFGDVTVSRDGSQLFTNSFSNVDTNPVQCQGAQSGGPATLKSYTVASGSTHTIYSSKNLAILRIQPVNARTLLMYIDNNIGDMSQNGLWKINTDGTGLTRLTTVNDQKCRDLGYWELSPRIASNAQSYAMALPDSRNYDPSIVVGSLSGGAPITIATKAEVLRSPRAHFSPYLLLVGMS